MSVIPTEKKTKLESFIDSFVGFVFKKKKKRLQKTTTQFHFWLTMVRAMSSFMISLVPP